MLTPNLLQHLKRSGVGVYMVLMDFERTSDSFYQDLLTILFEKYDLVDQLKN